MGLALSTRSNESLKRSNVKLQAQQVTSYNGNALNWRSWKKKTRAAIGTAGLLNILDDEAYAKRNPVDNETVFHILQVATSDGSASHLVDQFEDTKDGQKAYEALVSWYEGDELTTETAEDIRSKFDKLTLSTRTLASEYINLFQQYNKQLTDLGEEYTKSKTVNMFLTQITDPDYEATKELCIENRLSLNDCIERIRAKERRLTRDKGTKRRAEIVTRRERHERETPEKLSVDMDKYLTENGYYSIPDEVWEDLTKEERSTVKKYNLKVRRKRGRSYYNRSDRDDVSVRRNQNGTRNEDVEESPTKRNKTVQFVEDNPHDKAVRSNDLNDQPVAHTTRRDVLTFSTRNSNTERSNRE